MEDKIVQEFIRSQEFQLVIIIFGLLILLCVGMAFYNWYEQRKETYVKRKNKGWKLLEEKY